MTNPMSNFHYAIKVTKLYSIWSTTLLQYQKQFTYKILQDYYFYHSFNYLSTCCPKSIETLLEIL